ncbi:Programmed cell death 6interacting proteinlike [Caligus rogercresseyi]|uniref:Programmed cell death 6interacting proteinlike n=1 Tax=Caligus rogercresseyi TaxID=217165 RepID=A0A7T8GYW5_CALRO|nr:Programmed cell death 6interacting proteinlike [Caligus rogercresseyi]
MKSSTLSKLCKQVDVYYSATLTNMQKEGLKHLWRATGSRTLGPNRRTMPDWHTTIWGSWLLRK